MHANGAASHLVPVRIIDLFPAVKAAWPVMVPPAHREVIQHSIRRPCVVVAHDHPEETGIVDVSAVVRRVCLQGVQVPQLLQVPMCAVTKR